MNLLLLMVVLALLPPPQESARRAPLSNGDVVVQVDSRWGTLIASSRPLRTVEGPLVELSRGIREWSSVSWGERFRFEAVAGGPDWQSRARQEPVGRIATGGRVVSRLRAAALRLTTDVRFDPENPRYLLFHIRVENTGSGVLPEVLYSREWQAGEGTFVQQGPWPRAILDDSPVARRQWPLGDLGPGESRDVHFSYTLVESPPTRLDEIPLELWTNAEYPSGLPVGRTNGISFFDVDGDELADIVAAQGGSVWRNVGGTTFDLMADLSSLLPFGFRYDVGIADYDRNGLADLATEPRTGLGGDTCFHLLEHRAPGVFADVATDPQRLDLQPCGDTETACWGDVDADGDLDLFLPAYPPWVNGNPGNFFLENLGPTAPGGAFCFSERSAEAGLDTPPGTARPEGAQFCDVDFDGDLDLYSNGTLYQNVSSFGPAFEPLTESASGIGFSDQLEEGAAFFDYDLDGDFDLVVVYNGPGVRIWESYGDGSFFEASQEMIQSPFVGLGLGLSAEDWDGDGDIDFTTRGIFRRNRLIESGIRFFAVAFHDLPAEHLTSATPAWADWDHDGDLDCALGNWLDFGHFYENTLYDAQTPHRERRAVRLRIIEDTDASGRATGAPFGASVEILIASDDDLRRRRKFVASSHGYLNQNEMSLTFALPNERPFEDILFSVSADFVSPAGLLRRVDRHLNPLLGGVRLQQLTRREIVIEQNGTVHIDDRTETPPPQRSRFLQTTSSGLAKPGPDTPLVEPTPADSGTWVGLDLEHFGATSARIEEVILDGELAPAIDCDEGSFNLALWDVTDPSAPRLQGHRLRTTSPRNRRSFLRERFVLAPGHRYRLVAKVRSWRTSPISGPALHEPLLVHGGVRFVDAEPCSGQAAAQALHDPDHVFLAVRFRSMTLSGDPDLGDPLPPRDIDDR